MIKIYTDGACSGNPGPGGWASIIFKKDTKIILSGFKKYTTNNEMELMAIKESLIYFSKSQNIELYTDSKYAKNGIEKWMHKWKINNWKKENGPIKNLYLWKIIYDQFNFHKLKIFWVKAHSNDVNNNEVDEIARREISINIKK